MADSDVLRQHLGERIPAGGTDADTFFSHAEINQLLADAGDNVVVAAYQGWLAKASEYANLVNTSEGGSRVDMSDLHKHALEMVKHYREISGGLPGARSVSIKLAARE